MTSRITDRPLSASSRRLDSAKPVKHEPCSSTLGKFHDSVNYSLNSSGLASSRRNQSAKLNEHHPIVEARQKYKYMENQKSYVDESLFGSATHRSNTNNDSYNIRNHLSHNLMSNMAPLIHNPPLRVAPSSARQQQPDRADEVRDRVVEQPPKPPVRPWRP